MKQNDDFEEKTKKQKWTWFTSDFDHPIMFRDYLLQCHIIKPDNLLKVQDYILDVK